MIIFLYGYFILDIFAKESNGIYFDMSQLCVVMGTAYTFLNHICSCLTLCHPFATFADKLTKSYIIKNSVQQLKNNQDKHAYAWTRIQQINCAHSLQCFRAHTWLSWIQCTCPLVHRIRSLANLTTLINNGKYIEELIIYIRIMQLARKLAALMHSRLKPWWDLMRESINVHT